MDPSANPSFESLYPSSTDNPFKGLRLPRCLTTFKYRGHRPNKKSLSLRRPKDEHEKPTLEDAGRSQSLDSGQITWKRRGQTPGMDDYLTLEQLENFWHQQDFYVGCASAPQKVTEYSYTEAVEAPLIAEHGPNARRQQVSRSSPKRSNPLPDVARQSDTTITDSTIHPALRPVPYLKDSIILAPGAAPLSRLAIAVPDTNWTYGRD